MNQFIFRTSQEESDLVLRKQKKRNRILGIILILFALSVIILTFFVYGNYN
ncbi:MAG: hypothetical protein RBG1_1C00001G1294 [candidate division Zixibacteria bacterium RBG-1]|nr:MAG: hypothetical protein RBG1_1C00001G1294 [candidate division Zixibacteria bacterium RBG-1]